VFGTSLFSLAALYAMNVWGKREEKEIKDNQGYGIQ
jgi:hypothetical protein